MGKKKVLVKVQPEGKYGEFLSFTIKSGNFEVGPR
jgi:hypothetical protein